MTALQPRPVVAVIGTTGVGKSQLAVSLAQSLGLLRDAPQAAHGDGDAKPVAPPASQSTPSPPRSGVVLSADSMQLYKGLDVITNKVTREGMGGVEHWGLDMVVPGEEPSWELGRWCSEADKKLMERRTFVRLMQQLSNLPPSILPIICGGTHYFIQHFLFPPPELSFARVRETGVQSSSPSSKGKDLIPPLDVRWKPPCPHPPIAHLDLEPELASLLETFWTAEPVWPASPRRAYHDGAAGSDRDAASSRGTSYRPTLSGEHQLLSMHRLLATVDPREAGRWHWRDGRKVKRGLERWWESGREARPVDETAADASLAGRRARFRTIIFWVYEPLETLRSRLDRRVDNMVENGLLREIAELSGVAERMYGSAEEADHTEGIFQAIGYKEFSSLRLPQANPVADPHFPSMLARMKLRTHQYARSQLKWIAKQLLPAVKEARALGGDVRVFVVRGGGVDEALAASLLNAFLDGRDLPDYRTVGHPDAAALLAILDDLDGPIPVPDTAERQKINSRRDCEVCSTTNDPVSIMVRDWDLHVQSKPHRSRMQQAEGGRAVRIAAQKAEGLRIRAEREAARAAKGQSEMTAETSHANTA